MSTPTIAINLRKSPSFQQISLLCMKNQNDDNLSIISHPYNPPDLHLYLHCAQNRIKQQQQQQQTIEAYNYALEIRKEKNKNTEIEFPNVIWKNSNNLCIAITWNSVTCAVERKNFIGNSFDVFFILLVHPTILVCILNRFVVFLLIKYWYIL